MPVCIPGLADIAGLIAQLQSSSCPVTELKCGPPRIAFWFEFLKMSPECLNESMKWPIFLKILCVFSDIQNLKKKIKVQKISYRTQGVPRLGCSIQEWGLVVTRQFYLLAAGEGDGLSIQSSVSSRSGLPIADMHCSVNYALISSLWLPAFTGLGSYEALPVNSLTRWSAKYWATF